MSREVFVSYTSADKVCAFEIVEYLENAGVSCFIAPRNIDPGRPFASNIMCAIEECEVAVLISSASINASEHVLNEIDVIFSKKKKLIPFFIEEFEMNDDFRYYIGRKQHILAYPSDTRIYYSKLLNAIKLEVSSQRVSNRVKQESDTTEIISPQTVFKYIPERGIMINPEDYQRNVSFRTDTLINMLSGIYNDIADNIGEKKAEEIFFKSGYMSGKNFAKRLCEQWNNESISISEKLVKWCKFDSCVGWGNFNISVSIDEENSCLEGELKINECFIVDKSSNCKICTFIKGYCESIIETICGNIHLELECVECPMKSRFKLGCIFHIKMKESNNL